LKLYTSQEFFVNAGEVTLPYFEEYSNFDPVPFTVFCAGVIMLVSVTDPEKTSRFSVEVPLNPVR
jgi:hypothetical protein